MRPFPTFAKRPILSTSIAKYYNDIRVPFKQWFNILAIQETANRGIIIHRSWVHGTLTEDAKEAIYLKTFVTELELHDLADVEVFDDNMGTQKLALNPALHSRTKHMDIRHHFIGKA